MQCPPWFIKISLSANRMQDTISVDQRFISKFTHYREIVGYKRFLWFFYCPIYETKKRTQKQLKEVERNIISKFYEEFPMQRLLVTDKMVRDAIDRIDLDS